MDDPPHYLIRIIFRPSVRSNVTAAKSPSATALALEPRNLRTAGIGAKEEAIAAGGAAAISLLELSKPSPEDLVGAISVALRFLVKVDSELEQMLNIALMIGEVPARQAADVADAMHYSAAHS